MTCPMENCSFKISRNLYPAHFLDHGLGLYQKLEDTNKVNGELNIDKDFNVTINGQKAWMYCLDDDSKFLFQRNFKKDRVIFSLMFLGSVERSKKFNWNMMVKFQSGEECSYKGPVLTPLSRKFSGLSFHVDDLGNESNEHLENITFELIITDLTSTEEIMESTRISEDITDLTSTEEKMESTLISEITDTESIEIIEKPDSNSTENSDFQNLDFFPF